MLLRNASRIVIFAVALVTATLAYAPSAGAVTAPANNNFANAIAISGTTGSHTGTTLGATTEAGEPLPFATSGHSVWYTYTGIAAGTFLVDACSTNDFNSIVTTYTGTAVGALTPIGASDGTCGAAGVVRVDVATGTVVRVAVSTFGDGQAFTLHWKSVPATKPLVDFGSDRTLNCTTSNIANDWLQFFAVPTEKPPPLSCATIVSVPGKGLFGPLEFGDHDGFVGTTKLHVYTPVSQKRSATRVRTTVALPGTSLRLQQTETYTGGNSVQVAVTLQNRGTTPVDAVVYRTGDCFPGDDFGFALTGNGAAGCEIAPEHGLAARPAPADPFIRFEPTVGASHFAASDVLTIRNAIASGTPLTDSCTCGAPIDVAAALSWSVHAGTRANTSIASTTTMSVGDGRDPVVLAPTLSGRTGRWDLTAHLTDAGSPVAGAPVVFTRGALTACTVVTDTAGTATCRVKGRTDVYTATYIGNAWHRPAIETFGTADPHPARPGPKFPACARFVPDDEPVGTLGDGHFFEVVIPTQAPPCPTVIYRAFSDGVEVGELRGDLASVISITGQKLGITYLYITEPLHAGIAGCLTVESIDPRTGAVIDRSPEPTSISPCLAGVGGQKFR